MISSDATVSLETRCRIISCTEASEDLPPDQEPFLSCYTILRQANYLDGSNFPFSLIFLRCPFLRFKESGLSDYLAVCLLRIVMHCERYSSREPHLFLASPRVRHCTFPPSAPDYKDKTFQLQDALMKLPRELHFPEIQCS